MAYRRRFRLQLPRQFRSYRPNAGEGAGFLNVTSIFLMVFVSIMVYTSFLLPGINDLECGVDYDTEFLDWRARLDSSGQDKYADALLIRNDGARIAAFQAIPTTPASSTSPASPMYPTCESAVPTGDARYYQAYQVLVTFMPLLVLLLLIFLVFKQSGSISMFPAIILALIIRELIPGEGTIDWVVLMIGIAIACIPIPVGGLLGALSHVGALALWPTMILAYAAAADDAGTTIAPAVEQVFEFMVWVMPIGILIFSPLVWQMRGGARQGASQVSE